MGTLYGYDRVVYETPEVEAEEPSDEGAGVETGDSRSSYHSRYLSDPWVSSNVLFVDDNTTGWNVGFFEEVLSSEDDNEHAMDDPISLRPLDSLRDKSDSPCCKTSCPCTNGRQWKRLD